MKLVLFTVFLFATSQIVIGQQDCQAEISTFKQCLRGNKTEKAAALKIAMDACFLENNCTVPPTGNPSGDASGCDPRAVIDRVKPELETCVKRTVPNFSMQDFEWPKGPHGPFPHPPPPPHAFPGGPGGYPMPQPFPAVMPVPGVPGMTPGGFPSFSVNQQAFGGASFAAGPAANQGNIPHARPYRGAGFARPNFVVPNSGRPISFPTDPLAEFCPDGQSSQKVQLCLQGLHSQEEMQVKIVSPKEQRASVKKCFSELSCECRKQMEDDHEKVQEALCTCSNDTAVQAAFGNCSFASQFLHHFCESEDFGFMGGQGPWTGGIPLGPWFPPVPSGVVNGPVVNSFGGFPGGFGNHFPTGFGGNGMNVQVGNGPNSWVSVNTFSAPGPVFPANGGFTGGASGNMFPVNQFGNGPSSGFGSGPAVNQYGSQVNGFGGNPASSGFAPNRIVNPVNPVGNQQAAGSGFSGFAQVRPDTNQFNGGSSSSIGWGGVPVNPFGSQMANGGIGSFAGSNGFKGGPSPFNTAGSNPKNPKQ